MRCLVSLFFVLFAVSAHAQNCVPASARTGTVGCFPALPSVMSSTDYLAGWQPSGGSAGISVKITPSQILEASLPGRFSAAAVGSGTNNIMTITPGASTSAPIVFQSTSGNTGGIQLNPGSTGLLIGATGTGKVTMGNVVLGQNNSYSQTAAVNRPLSVVANPTGTLSSSIGALNQFVIGNDILAYTGQGFAALYTTLTTGTGFTGNRWSLFSNLNVATQGSGGNQQHVVGFFQGQMGVTQGGTSPVPGSARGSLFGLNPNVQLNGTATNISSLIGMEINTAILGSATSAEQIGLQIVKTTAATTQGSSEDVAFRIADQNELAVPGWKTLMAVGNLLSQNPGGTSSKLLVVRPQSSTIIAAGVTYQLKKPQLLWGVNLSFADFTGATNGQSLVLPGVAVGATGSTTVGSLLFASTTGGGSISAPYSRVTAATVSTAGGSVTAPYYPGDPVFGLDAADAPYPGQYTVATVKAVDGSTIASAGTGGTPGAAVVTLVGGTGTAPQLNVTIGAGGTITSVDSVAVAGSLSATITSGGAQTNRAWPVTGGGLSGATINVALGANTVTVPTDGRADISTTTPATITLRDSDIGGSRGAIITPTWTAENTIYLASGGGVLKTGAGTWTANGSVATTMTSLGPTGSHTTIQEWFTVTNSSGVVRYIPAY